MSPVLIINRLYLKRVKTLDSSPKTLMTRWPSKQITNIDATTKKYEKKEKKQKSRKKETTLN